mmetsp:Transcript_43680/g.105355  ORF Transcript_43680/g.105355 Transcript_43680/m.105355 type:complete len:208 (-) Transcript_43680:400-1023(-)
MISLGSGTGGRPSHGLLLLLMLMTTGHWLLLHIRLLWLFLKLMGKSSILCHRLGSRGCFGGRNGRRNGSYRSCRKSFEWRKSSSRSGSRLHLSSSGFLGFIFLRSKLNSLCCRQVRIRRLCSRGRLTPSHSIGQGTKVFAFRPPTGSHGGRWSWWWRDWSRCWTSRFHGHGSKIFSFWTAIWRTGCRDWLLLRLLRRCGLFPCLGCH